MGDDKNKINVMLINISCQSIRLRKKLSRQINFKNVSFLNILLNSSIK